MIRDNGYVALTDLGVEGEPMVDAGGEHQQVSRHHLHPQPLVRAASHIEVTRAGQDETNLLVHMKMLSEEILHLKAFRRVQSRTNVVS